MTDHSVYLYRYHLYLEEFYEEAGHVAGRGEKINACRILVGKSEDRGSI
jgi:hypothetical protein